MSVCRVEGGLKRKHKYPDGSNKCSNCGHVTTHGKNFRLVSTPKKEK
jgi:hypothetical protein